MHTQDSFVINILCTSNPCAYNIVELLILIRQYQCTYTVQLNLNFTYTCQYTHVYACLPFVYLTNWCACTLLHAILACACLPVNKHKTPVIHITSLYLVCYIHVQCTGTVYTLLILASSCIHMSLFKTRYHLLFHRNILNIVLIYNNVNHLL